MKFIKYKENKEGLIKEVDKKVIRNSTKHLTLHIHIDLVSQIYSFNHYFLLFKSFNLFGTYFERSKKERVTIS